ncbi:MAG: hypothetical protein LC128_11680 [Chitinophagales bacterium]|nr:hypothetical protein [Chitinophagales bacterium]
MMQLANDKNLWSNKIFNNELNTQNTIILKTQYFFAIFFSLILLMTERSYCQSGLPDYSAEDKAKALKDISNDCTSLKEKYDAIEGWIKAHKGTHPEIPIPPLIDPDCHDCKENNYTDKNQPIIDAFNKKSVQPESDMISTLLQIAKDKTILLGGHSTVGGSLVSSSYDNGDAYPCLNNITDNDIQKSIDFLALWAKEKIDMMVKKYMNSGDYFLGGVQYYFSVLRDLSLLGYTKGDLNDDFKTWAKNYYEKYKNRLLKQYQYQLYPGIFYLPRDIEMMGIKLEDRKKLVNNNGQFSIEHVNEVAEAWNKAISLMHFKLTISYSGDGLDKDGNKVTVRFGGETEIRCRVITSDEGPCYTWEPENGNTMTFKIEQAEFLGHDKEALAYAGPKEFNVPVKFNINMCDKEPVFRIFFDRLWPTEEHYKSNQAGEMTIPMLYRVVSSTLSKANTENLKKEINKYKKAENNFSESEMEAWNRRMTVHGNDSNYFKTAQGKKDLAIARKLKAQFGSVSSADQKKMDSLLIIKKSIERKEKANPNYIGSAEYFRDRQKLKEASATGNRIMEKSTGGALTLNKLELPFKIGSTQPVNGTVGDDEGTTLLAIENGELNYKSSFKIELINTPDNRDNMKKW